MNLIKPAATIHPRTEHADRGSAHPLPLGIIVYDNGLKADELLNLCAIDMAALGFRLGGIVQSNRHRQARRKCDMYLKDLLSGEEILISADRGNEARGCRLDPAAFVRIGVWGDRALAEGVDLLILNKFGKEEAQGRGLRPLIAAALVAGTPVLIGVPRTNVDDFFAFISDAVRPLPLDRRAIATWCQNAIRAQTRRE